MADTEICSLIVETILNELSISNECRQTDNKTLEDPVVEHKNSDEAVKEKISQIKELEQQRQRIENNILRLEHEIKEEKLFFKRTTSSELFHKAETEKHPSPTNRERLRIDPLNFNSDDMKSKLTEFRDVLEESKSSSKEFENDYDIERIKKNLVTSKKVLETAKSSNCVQQKRRAAAKIFRKHLDEVEHQCTAKIEEDMAKMKTCIDVYSNLR